MSSPSTFECFGLVIHGLDWERVREKIDYAVSRREQLWIVTTNPEILLEAKRNPSYWQTVRQADLRLVDGFGLKLVGRLFGARLERLTGVELSEQLLQIAEERNWKVAFIGGGKDSGDKAAWEIRKRFTRLRIVTERAGTIGNDGAGDVATDEALQRLTLEAPDVMLVAFGHPKQEAWIARHLAELPSVKVAVGVGGTFDYWSGGASRAPMWMRSIGLEWLWRVAHEPKRWKRIWNAVVVFPLTAIFSRLDHKTA
ncbi:MAG: WecB/TagA/CpsF family glycosyltransferase [Patescibacteria group bacterium]